MKSQQRRQIVKRHPRRNTADTLRPWGQLPEHGFVRERQILGVLPFSPNSWRRGVRSGRFPPGILIGPRMRAWPVEQIREILESFALVVVVFVLSLLAG
jgi:prophage regulatory protein